MTLPVALPYGIRDVKLTRYTDGSGTVLSGVSVDLANAQTLSFSEKEEFAELRGDDRIVAVRGKGANVDWSLEGGGISFVVWSIFTGGSVTETGVTPNRRVQMRKFSSDTRPYFRIEGRAISDSGGDVHCFIYRCKANSDVKGDWKDGEYVVTSCSGQGLPLVNVDTFDLLYEFIHNETAIAISTTPTPNPIV